MCVHQLVRILPVSQSSSISILASITFWILQVRYLTRSIKPDILHAHFIGVPGYLGAISGFHLFVLSAWGSDVLTIPKRNWVFGFMTEHAVREADWIICVWPMLKDKLIELGAKAEKIEVTPIGVGTQKFSPGARSEALLRGLGMSGSPVVISTRNLGPVYDVRTRVKAIPLILQELPQDKFIIAGDGEQRSHLENLATTIGVSGSVRFTGWIPSDELPKYLASSDVYVSTSLSDGTSISLLEALACGLAPVVTDIPANRTWVNDEETVLLFFPGDDETLAARIIRLLKDRDIRIRFGRSGRDIIMRKADFKKEM